MPFDVDAFRAAHRPWMLTIDGRAFTARHVSAPQVLEYQDRLRTAGDNATAVERALRWLLRRAFPWRPSYLVRGDPARLLLHLEPAARAAAFADFFEALRGGPTPTTQTGTRPATRGTTLPMPISTRRT